MLFLQGCLGKLKNGFASNFLSTGAGVVAMFIIQVWNIWTYVLSLAESVGLRGFRKAARQDFNKVGEEMYNFQLKINKQVALQSSPTPSLYHVAS